jgi:phage baseplate assembly protein W
MTYIYNAPIPYNEEQPYDFSGAWGSAGAPPVILPHLNASMALSSDGTFQFWQQGTIDEVAQSVEMVCGTTIGDRTVVPQFGLPQLVFNITQNQKAILAAINAWEPRATVTVNIQSNNQGDTTIQVNTALKQGSTQ